MEILRIESCIRGYHIYKEVWEAVVGEELECKRECDNPLYALIIRQCKTFVR